MPVSKILHVIPSVGPLRGGPSAMVRQLAGSLVRAGAEVHVATTNDNGNGFLQVPCGEPVDHEGVTYWYFARQTRFYTFSWALGAWLASHVSDYDVVHIHALFSYAALPAAYWSHRRGVPYVLRPLGTLNEWGMANRRPWLKRASFFMLESQIVKHAALLHYTSEQERREAESLGVTAASVVVPNPTPTVPPGDFSGRFLEQYPWLRGRKIVLFLSRLDPKKGLDLLLRAFAKVRYRLDNVALLIAGDGLASLTQRLRVQATDLRIADDVLWMGFLTGADKQAAFAAADIFVLPSYSENFGIAVAEAMAAGLPVVVSDQVGIHGDVTKATAGLVVPCQERDLTEALVRLLGDGDLCASMGRNGKELAATKYSQIAVTTEMMQVYNRLAN